VASEAERICPSRLENRGLIETSLNGPAVGCGDKARQRALPNLSRADDQGNARVTDRPANRGFDATRDEREIGQKILRVRARPASPARKARI
jgi:hypothetical protein